MTTQGLAERMERYHLDTLRRTLGRPATYKTGRKKAVPVTVISLETNTDPLDFDGVTLSPESKIFLIGTDEVPDPKPDDVIELDGQQWKVTRIGDGQPWSARHGQCGLGYKIHARKT